MQNMHQASVPFLKVFRAKLFGKAWEEGKTIFHKINTVGSNVGTVSQDICILSRTRNVNESRNV